MGLVPKKARSDIKLYKSFTIQRVFGLIATIVLATVLCNLVVERLRILFIIFLVANFLVLSGKSVEDGNKPFYIGLKQWITYRLKHKSMYGDSNEQVQAIERSKEREEERKHAKRTAKEKAKNKVSKHIK